MTTPNDPADDDDDPPMHPEKAKRFQETLDALAFHARHLRSLVHQQHIITKFEESKEESPDEEH